MLVSNVTDKNVKDEWHVVAPRGKIVSTFDSDEGAIKHARERSEKVGVKFRLQHVQTITTEIEY